MVQQSQADEVGRGSGTCARCPPVFSWWAAWPTGQARRGGEVFAVPAAAPHSPNKDGGRQTAMANDGEKRDEAAGVVGPLRRAKRQQRATRRRTPRRTAEPESHTRRPARQPRSPQLWIAVGLFVVAGVLAYPYVAGAVRKTVREVIAPITMADVQRWAQVWKARQEAWSKECQRVRESDYKSPYRIDYGEAQSLLRSARVTIRLMESEVLQEDQFWVRQREKKLQKLTREWQARWAGKGLRRR